MEQIREEAHKSALNHDPFINRKPLNRFWRVNKSDIENLRTFIEELREKPSPCSQPAEEWLLDNAEFLEEQALVIKQELSKKLVNKLPYLSKTGEPRIFSICTDYIKYTDGNLNLDSFISYIRSYQEVSILSIAEVWTFPLIMRVSLIHHLAGIMKILRERNKVCASVEDLLSGIETTEITPESLNQVLEEAGYEIPLSGPMIVHLVTHLRERADYSATVGEWLICKLENGPESLDHILSYEYQLQATYGLSTGNIIGSLRRLSRLDWREPFEQISIVVQTLRKESTDSYFLLDSSSRDTLLNRVEVLSRRLNLPENLVATAVVEQVDEFVKINSKEYGKDLPRQATVSYYLLEPNGVKALRQGLKKCGKPRILPETGLLRRSTGTYFNMLATFFAVTLIAFSILIGWNELFTPLEWTFILIILSFPAMEWSITAAHWFIERVKRPVPLLRYDFSSNTTRFTI